MQPSFADDGLSMDDLLLAVFGLGVIAIVAVLPGLLAFLHSRRLQERVARLEQELARVRELGRATSASTGDRSAPSSATPAPASPPSAPSPAVGRGAPSTPHVASAAPAEAPAPSRASAPPSTTAPSTTPAMTTPADLPTSPSPTRPSPTSTTADAWGSRAAVPAPPPWTGTASTPAVPDARPANATPSRATPAASESAFDFERWVGVRGAAVLGGIVIAISGYFLLQYSIERGYFTPRARVILAAIGGVTCLLASFPLRSRGYEIVANSVSGAGAVILFASAWAAHVLYGMIGFELAFGAMVATTATCMFLAHRHASLVIAVLGLVGGFATPVVLASGNDQPIPLFGYVLLLDLGFLFVARRRRWPSIGVIALCGTFVLQGLWILRRMSSESLVVGLVVLAVFALVFATFVARLPSEDRRRWAASQVGALVLPFVFALYFSQERDLGAHLAPIAALAWVLTVASGWLARTSGMAWLPYGSAAGSVALAFTWCASRDMRLSTSESVELAICVVVAVVTHAVFAEIAHRRDRAASATDEGRADVLRGARDAAATCALGISLLAVFVAGRSLDVGPRATTAIGIAVIVITFRLVSLGAHGAFAIASSGLSGTGLLVWAAAHGSSALVPRPIVWCASVAAIGGLVLGGVAWCRRASTHRPERSWIAFAVAAFVVPVIFAPSQFGSVFADHVSLFVACGAIASLQVACAASLASSSPLFLVAIACAWTTCLSSGVREHVFAGGPRLTPLFGISVAVAVALTWWPVARPQAWKGRATAWRAAALVPLLWFPQFHAMFVARWGSAPIFLLPLGLELIAGSAAIRLNATRADEDRARRVGRAWFACSAILFAAMIVPLQAGRDEAALTLALFAPGVVLYWRREGASALRWVAAVAAALAITWLAVVRPWSSFPHSSVRVWNEVGWSYGVATLAVLAAVILARRKVVGATEPAGVPAAILGVCVVVSGFAWINVEIANAFAAGVRFTWQYEHDPARNLTVSIAWAVYAIVLLVVGVATGRAGPRWASLVLVLLTIAKVFLFDLGHLTGLYRAASVFGLGVSLLLVSLLYQRFVFRRVRATPT